MTSFENYMKSLVMTGAFRIYGDANVRASIISQTLNNLTYSDPELKKALEVELNRQNLI